MPDMKTLTVNGTTYNIVDETARLGAGIAPRLLWSGSWSSGTITIPDTDKYLLFRISMVGQGTSVLATKAGSHIRGIGGYSSETPTITTYHFAATLSNNEWTFVALNSFSHIPNGAHGSIPTDQLVISSIYGLC